MDLDLIKSLGMGSKVYSSKETGVCEAQEKGIVYEVYEICGRKGVSIIFEQGGYDGFSPEDCERFIVFEGSVEKKCASYKFENVMKLGSDYAHGYFDYSNFKKFEDLERQDMEKDVQSALMKGSLKL